jgi:hypothetical protein
MSAPARPDMHPNREFWPSYRILSPVQPKGYTQESRLSSCMGLRRVKSFDRRDPRRVKEARDCFRQSFLFSC